MLLIGNILDQSLPSDLVLLPDIAPCEMNLPQCALYHHFCKHIDSVDSNLQSRNVLERKPSGHPEAAPTGGLAANRQVHHSLPPLPRNISTHSLQGTSTRSAASIWCLHLVNSLGYTLQDAALQAIV